MENKNELAFYYNEISLISLGRGLGRGPSGGVLAACCVLAPGFMCRYNAGTPGHRSDAPFDAVCVRRERSRIKIS